VNEERRYILDRINQFNEYENNAQKEHGLYKSNYVRSAELIEPSLTLVARASVVGLPLLAFLVQITTNTSTNWLGISGAAITVIGVLLQMHWTEQASFVREMREIESERDSRFAIYYNFRIHPHVIECVPFPPEEDSAILKSLHSERSTELRRLRGSMVKDQNRFVLCLLIIGTSIWALA